MHIHIINSTTFGGAETVAAKLSKHFGGSILISIFEKNIKFQERFNVQVRGIVFLIKLFLKKNNLKIFTHNLQSHILFNLLSVFGKMIFTKDFEIYNIVHFDAYHVKRKWLNLYIKTSKFVRPEIIFVSKFAKLRLEQMFNLKGLKTKIIYNSVDDKFFTYAGDKNLSEINSKRIYIGFIGRNKPVKRLSLFLEICDQLFKIDKSRYRFVIQSDASQEDLKDLISNISFNKNISIKHNNFKLISSDDNPIKFYDRCDIVISTSKTESFGLVCIETLAMGKRFYSLNSESLKMLFGNSSINISFENPKLVSEFINDDISRKYLIPDISNFKEAVMINEYSKI